MISVLTGAYQNIGDHLIQKRALDLISNFVSTETKVYARSNIKSNIDEIKSSKIIILAGGPLLQQNFVPNIIAQELLDINVPIIPFGVGLKCTTEYDYKHYEFNKPSLDFLKTIHQRIDSSSVRDHLTLETLRKHGIHNVTFTGCPAWYDLSKTDTAPATFTEPRKIAYSVPAQVGRESSTIITYLQRRFPNAEIFCTYHHGHLADCDLNSIKKSLGYHALALKAKLKGLKNIWFTPDVSQMSFYNQMDLHIGLRVHAHLYCLSQKIPSLLINEDMRGFGQNQALGGIQLFSSDPQLEVKLDQMFESSFNGAHFQKVDQLISLKYQDMKRFLSKIHEQL